MIRTDMISTVGRAYLTSNIENDEYSYPKAFSAASLTFAPIQNSAGRRFEKLDIRFVKDNVSVLIETKQNFTVADEEQLRILIITHLLFQISILPSMFPHLLFFLYIHGIIVMILKVNLLKYFAILALMMEKNTLLSSKSIT